MCYNITNENSHYESYGEKRKKNRNGESHTTQLPNLNRVRMDAIVHNYRGYYVPFYDVKRINTLENYIVSANNSDSVHTMITMRIVMCRRTV